MEQYHVIIKLNGFTVPRSLYLKTNSSEFWLYPDTYLKEIYELDIKKSLEEQKFIESDRGFRTAYLKREREGSIYVCTEISLDLDKTSEDIVNQIWLKYKPLILIIDLLLSNRHVISSYFIFNQNKHFKRFIKVNDLNPTWSLQPENFHDSSFIDLEYLLSQLVDVLEKKQLYLPDLELFLCGKIFWELKGISPRKSRRDPLDCLSDIWEALEHLSAIFWIEKGLRQNDTKEYKIKLMCSEIQCNLSQDDEDLIHEVYKEYYNFKKHETSDLSNYDFTKLEGKLYSIIKLIEKIFLTAFGAFPNFINFRELTEDHSVIVSTQKAMEHNSLKSYEEQKQDLMLRPKYTGFIQFITHFEVEKNPVADHFEFLDGILVKPALKKPVKLRRLEDFQIIFDMYEISKETDTDQIWRQSQIQIDIANVSLRFSLFKGSMTPPRSSMVVVEAELYYIDVEWHFHY